MFLSQAVYLLIELVWALLSFFPPVSALHVSAKVVRLGEHFRLLARLLFWDFYSLKCASLESTIGRFELTDLSSCASPAIHSICDHHQVLWLSMPQLHIGKRRKMSSPSQSY